MLWKPGSTVCSLCAVLLLAMAGRAEAQVFEIVGVRAQGMGGAFVALADDATATWWNPAGLVTGKLFSLTIDYDTVDDPDKPGVLGPARRDAATGFAAAFPSLAISYYRFRISEVSPDSILGPARVLALSINQLGTTVGQSLGNHLVVGTTVKLLRAGQVITTAPPGVTGEGLLDAAEDLDIDRDTKSDLDLGVMAALGVLRLGVTAKNLWAPAFGDDLVSFKLQRQTRAGIALVKPRLAGLISSVSVAADMDVLRTETVHGDLRRFGTGVEIGLSRLRTGLRSGFSMNTVGEKNITGSAGVTLAAPFGFYFDAAVLFGSDDVRNGLSLGASMTF